MAKQQRDPAREKYWRGLVSEWQASGLSVREFSRQRQVTEASFYSWRRELQRRDAQTPAAPAFVPVTVVPTTALVEVRCPTGHVVTVTNADHNTLRQLLAALAPEAPC
jgi:transposase-like protein